MTEVLSPAVAAGINMGSEGLDPRRRLIPVCGGRLSHMGGSTDGNVWFEVAILPLSIAEFLSKGGDSLTLTNWLEAVTKISGITEKDGFHWNGRLMAGMPIDSLCEEDAFQGYGRMREALFNEAAEKAWSTGQAQYVPMGLMGSRILPVWLSAANIHIRGLREKIVEQNGDGRGQITIVDPTDKTDCHFSADDTGIGPKKVIGVKSSNGACILCDKETDRLPAHPAAYCLYTKRPKGLEPNA